MCFSFDSRGHGLGKHFPADDDFATRAYFKLNENNPEDAVLLIEKIKDKDEGVYTCRADFIKTPTMRTITKLNVIGKKNLE